MLASSPNEDAALTAIAATALIVVIAGFAIGATSIGGVLVLPALTGLMGIDVVTAVAATSFAFLATGLLTLLDIGRQRTALQSALGDAPLHLAALAGATVGAVAVHLVPPGWVKVWIAVLAVLSGIHALVSAPAKTGPRAWPSTPVLTLMGLGVGFGSGLSGTGGPILLLPILLLLRQDMARAVAAALVLQIPIALASTTAHLLFGRLDLRIGVVVAIALAAGAWLGRHTSKRVDSRRLRQATGVVLLATGLVYLFA